MSRDWMLLETLGDEPTVIAIGMQARNAVPLASVLRRNRHLPVIDAAIAECRVAGELVITQTPSKDRIVRVYPIAIDRTQVYGVQVWFGPTGEEPPARPLAGAYRANMDTSIATVTKEYLDVAGVDPDDRSETRSITEDLAQLLPSLQDVELLANVVNPQLDTTFCGTSPRADFQGNLVQIHYAGRASREPSASGRTQLITRLLCTRIESGNSEPQVGLAQHILDAVTTPGFHRMLVNADNFTILRWIDEPYPDMAWQLDHNGASNVHPDDIDAARTMRDELGTGSTAGVLRIRSASGGWLRVYATATKFALRDDAFAALVTLSAADETD